MQIDDVCSAMEAQARDKFLNRQGLADVPSLGGTCDGEKEALEHESKLKSLSESKSLRDSDRFLILDLELVGVGDDGHVESLCPNGGEIDEINGPCVVPAFQKDQPSMHLALPLTQSAKCVVTSAADKSVKHPNVKASAKVLDVADENAAPKDFAASALRENTVWMFDEPNG